MGDIPERAVELAGDALEVLAGLMQDEHQPGTVRVAAAKHVMDYGFKLRDQQYEALDKLDQAMEDFRKGVELLDAPDQEGQG